MKLKLELSDDAVTWIESQVDARLYVSESAAVEGLIQKARDAEEMQRESLRIIRAASRKIDRVRGE